MTYAPARVLIRKPAPEAVRSRFAAEVAERLSRRPRQLPTSYLYDSLGSALFDAICRLPWYKVTRAETNLLERHAPDILEGVSHLTDIVELGPGNGAKLATLLEAGRERAEPLHVHLVDVSRAALDTAASALRAVPAVEIVAHQATYEAGLRDLQLSRAGRGQALVLFLGSNIGNFDPPAADALLTVIRASLRQGDGFVVGVDLVKAEKDLLLAYDDPLGVTAAFNRNLLSRLNRELGANFDLAGFRHLAVWNAEAARVEMHLVSTRRQRVRIPAAGVDIVLREGEAIWTESSYKYRAEEVVSLLERNGFTGCALWTHEEAQFSLTLARV